jgi:RNA polymerase nonessential primary-like sigma factor
LRARRELEKQFGASPNVEDIAAYMNRPVEQVREILEFNARMASLDSPLDVDPDLSVGDALPDDHSLTPEMLLQDIQMEANVREWLSELTDRQRAIIEYRFGLNGKKICTLEEISANLNLTRERVRQIQTEALHYLRRFLQSKGYTQDDLFE